MLHLIFCNTPFPHFIAQSQTRLHVEVEVDKFNKFVWNNQDNVSTANGMTKTMCPLRME